MHYLILVAFSIQALFFIPVLVGTLAENLAFTEVQLGGIAAADLAGFSLACLWVFLKANKLNWKKLIFWSALIAAAANLMCILVDSFWGLALLRGAAGLCSGVIYSIAMIAIARHSKAISMFGWSMASQGFVAMIALAALPHLLASYGMPIIFTLLAALTLACVFSSHYLGVFQSSLPPPSSITARSSSDVKVNYYAGATVLIGIFSLYLGQGGFTAFIERIGVHGGIAPDLIGYSLSVSSFAGVLAGLVAGFQAKKLGLRFPLVIVFCGQLLAICILWLVPSGFWIYLIVLAIYNFCWVYVVPFHMSIVDQQDTSGRLVALAPAVQGGGLAVGAALSGGILEATFGYDDFYFFIILSGLCSLSLVYWVATNRQGINEEQPLEASY